MSEPLRVLMVEDSETDARLLQRELRQAGYEPAVTRVENAVQMAAALQDASWDLVLCDYRLPQFNWSAALEMVHKRGRDVPFILVSGVIGDEQAVAAMKAGAHDFILKDKRARLIPAIARELRDAETRRQRRLAEEELHRQREWLRVTLTSIGDAVLTTDVAGRVTFLNPIASAVTGWSAEAALGQPIQTVFRIINDLTRQPAEDLVARVLQEGRVIALANHTSLLTRDGRTVPIEDSAAPIRDAAGNVTGVVLVFHDVTDKRRAAQALLQAKQEWERTFDSVPDLIAIIDQQHRIRRANRAMADRLGLTPEECVGRQCFACVHGSATCLSSCPHAQTLLDLREHTAEIQESRLGGTFIVTTTPLLDESQQMIGAVHVARDITERKRAETALRESEERFRGLVEMSPDAILLQVNGCCVFANPAAAILLGADSHAALEGREMLSLVHPEDTPILLEHLGGFGETMRPCSTPLEFRVLRLNGHPVPVEAVASLVSLHGAPAMQVILRDVTERRQAQEALRRAHDELEQRVRERTSELVATNAALQTEVTLRRDLEARIVKISESEQRRIGQDLHDGLCQQLAGLTYLCDVSHQQLAKRSPTDAAPLARITQLLRETVAQAHGLARGLFPVNLEASGLMAALQELVARFSEMYHVSGRFVCRVPVLVEDNAAATHLYRIAQEAISNAIKHGEATRVTLTIKSARQTLSLTVTDNGRGIPAELPKTGLGLETMRLRAHSIGGSLIIQPNRGGGTMVCCSLPAPLPKASTPPRDG